jgi:hypothetical protein
MHRSKDGGTSTMRLDPGDDPIGGRAPAGIRKSKIAAKMNATRMQVGPW